MGRAITCQELNAYRRIPVFLNVFSLLVPSLKLEKNQKQLTTNRSMGKNDVGGRGREKGGGEEWEEEPRGGGGGKLRGYCRPVL